MLLKSLFDRMIRAFRRSASGDRALARIGGRHEGRRTRQ
jgi:hypothetical protein